MNLSRIVASWFIGCVVLWVLSFASLVFLAVGVGLANLLQIVLPFITTETFVKGFFLLTIVPYLAGEIFMGIYNE